MALQSRPHRHTSPALRDRLAAALPPVSTLIRGSLLCEMHEGCDCHPNGRYGPYWRLSVNYGGRTRMYQLRPDQVPGVRRALKNYQRWWKACLRIMELNTQALLADKEDPTA